MDTPEALRRDIERLAQVIDAGEWDMVAFAPTDGGQPFVWVDRTGTYHWRVVERGQTLDSRTTTDRDELLYWALSSAAFSVASRWAREHPVPGEEYRVTLFRQEFALLHRLDPAWARRCRDELIRKLEGWGAIPDAGVPALPS